MSKLSRQAAIVGVAESELGKVGDKNPLQLQAMAAREALREAGIDKNEIEAVFSAGPYAYLQTMTISEYLGITPKFSDSTSLGGSSFEAHIEHALAGIHAGLFDVALITYGSNQRSKRVRPGASIAVNQFEAPYGMPFPVGAYALAAQRHMDLYGTTSEQLAEIAVGTRKWANLNPKAFAQGELTVDDVLNSPMVSSPLHALDCCLVTDGGGAIVLVSKEKAKECRTKPIWVLGTGETHTHLNITEMPDLTVTGARESGKRAFEMAGLRPDEIDVVQLYDSFTITVLLQLEDLGFCQKGEGGAFVENQRTAPGGAFPLNTSGGGLSYCHPGLFGIFLLIEAVRQLRHECGDRQVPDAQTALCNGMGGVLSSSCTVILGRD
ncbi:acetyl-CoA acetyltransferase [Bacillus sp. B15-48]|uniref:acetyl-CoA acetyltransferase n=1 Tax=Bacillus sp. B15-48 TaxID=1548601 RepID=UPI00193F50CA|nr:acetyl-CoA acetyltransferase [Bacillus sp. B15-48]MBM4763347.1 thiolase [Bacillus sp. B15-48]